MSTIATQSYRTVTPQRTLTPESPVVIVFRGGPPIVDKYDGRDVILPAEADEARLAGEPHWDRRYYEPVRIEQVPYGVALHVRERAIVPGTRDPRNGKRASYRIGIVETPTGQGVDRPEHCAPFTDEQLRHFDLPEGLDRTAFEDSRRNVTTLDTVASISHVGNLQEQLEAEPDADTLAPTAGSEGLRDVQADTAAYEGVGGSASRTRRGRPAFRGEG